MRRDSHGEKSSIKRGKGNLPRASEITPPRRRNQMRDDFCVGLCGSPEVPNTEGESDSGPQGATATMNVYETDTSLLVSAETCELCQAHLNRHVRLPI